MVVFSFSCNQENGNDGEETPCYAPWGHAIRIVNPLETSYSDGVFHIDCEILSDAECDAFLLLILMQDTKTFPPSDTVLWIDETPIDFSVCKEKYKDNDKLYYILKYENFLLKGIGNETKVDGFQIRSYHQLYKYRNSVKEIKYPSLFNLAAPIIEFPVFVKKIKVLKDVSVHERINVRLPEGVNNCWGEMVAFKNNQAIEESMKTKVDIEEFKKGDNYFFHHVITATKERFDTYYSFFPDSSMFSYLITSPMDLGFNYCDYSFNHDPKKQCSGIPLLGFSNIALFFDNYPLGVSFFFN